MTWHRLLSLAVCAALAACGSSSKNATIEITAPEKGQTLTTKEDVSSSKDGVQFNVTASSTGIAAGTDVQLRIGDSDDVPVAKVGSGGAIEFEAVTLPPGKHTLKVQTENAGVQSADDFDYTLKAIVIDRPQNNAAIGLVDDKDPNTDGIQINVSVSTYEVGLSEDVILKVDDATLGSAQHPNANGKLVFSGVTLAEGAHKLKVVAGDAESSTVTVTVSTTCATATFVTPEPSADNTPVKLGGGDKCPKNGEPFKADFTVSTDVGEGRDVDLVVNGTLFASTKVVGTLAKFTDVVLDRYKTANKVSVVVQSAQGVTCNPIPYPTDIMVDCDGVDCSISAPTPVSGNDASGNRVLYLNQSKKGKDGFEFEVHTIADAIGQPVKLLIDGKDTDAPSADPSGSDPDVKAKFSAVQLADGAHTIQARCELKNGSFGLSRLASWNVDTSPCGVKVKQPGADTLFSSSSDSDTTLSGTQVEVQSDLTGGDCSATRAAVCDPTAGISDKVGYDAFDGGASLTSTVTLTNDAAQTLCVEVKDRAGNVGRDSVSVRYNVEAPKVIIETPANNDKYNAAGGGDYKADSDPGSADVCNANFDVACTQLGTDVKLHRDSATGTVFATEKCQAKGGSDPALPSGYTGRARFKNAAFLAANTDTAKIVATQTLSAGGKDVVGESAAITLKGDCKKPVLKFAQDPCGGGQLAVATMNDTFSENIVAQDTTTKTKNATLLVTQGGTQFAMKEVAVSSGNYDFGSVNLGGPGSGKRSITIEVSAKDDYDNTGKVSCNADIVFDLPTLTVTSPTDNLVLVIGMNSAGSCVPTSGGMYGVTVAATADSATNRTASYSVGMGADSALGLSGTAISGCVPIVEGPNDVNIKLTSTSTTAVRKITRKVTLVGTAPSTGITIKAPTLPTDRSNKVTLTWDAPMESVSGQLAKYELRCDPNSLADSATADQKLTWWNGAGAVTLPADFKPPATSVDINFRVGDNSNCMLRAFDAANQPTALTSTTNVQIKFREKRITPTASPNAVQAGNELAAVGDVNRDGIADLLVGGGGEAYLVFGSTGLNSDAATPNITFSVRAYNPDNDYPLDVAGIGDWNGDGFNDFAISDLSFNGLQGRVLVYFGRTAAEWGNNARVNVGENCVADVCLIGPAGSAFGWSLSGAGDFVTGDNRADIAIGAPVTNSTVGRLYVLRYNNYATGTAPAAGSFYNASVTVDTGAEGFRYEGVAGTGATATRLLGNSVAGIGTFDGTAGADLVLGAPGSSAEAVLGRAFLLSGRNLAVGGGLVALTSGADTLIDSGPAEKFGTAVSALGNVIDVASASNPGKLDIGIFLAGNPGFFVYPGDTNFNPTSRFLVKAADSSGYDFGSVMCTAGTVGDLDGDGKSELCASGNAEAEVPPYLWYSDVLTRKLPGDTIYVTTGSPLQGTSGSGRRTVEFAGDLNNDGKPDLVVGTPTGNGGAGEFTILY